MVMILNILENVKQKRDKCVDEAEDFLDVEDNRFEVRANENEQATKSSDDANNTTPESITTILLVIGGAIFLTYLIRAELDRTMKRAWCNNSSHKIYQKCTFVTENQKIIEERLKRMMKIDYEVKDDDGYIRLFPLVPKELYRTTLFPVKNAQKNISYNERVKLTKTTCMLAKPGDILEFGFVKKIWQIWKFYSHYGIYIGNKEVIHLDREPGINWTGFILALIYTRSYQVQKSNFQEVAENKIASIRNNDTYFQYNKSICKQAFKAMMVTLLLYLIVTTTSVIILEDCNLHKIITYKKQTY
nr:hypothetical protein BgiMline_032035 [Biomphalaria glabrata]